MCFEYIHLSLKTLTSHDIDFPVNLSLIMHPENYVRTRNGADEVVFSRQMSEPGYWVIP